MITLALSAAACDSKKEEIAPQKTKSIAELQQEVKDERSPEELEKARREAGIISPEEAAAENMKEMEKGEREFVKTRLDKYKETTKSLRGLVDKVEKDAKTWAAAKDPQKDFDAWVETYQEEVKTFMSSYNDISENGIRGGALAATIGKTLRSWGQINNDLSPTIGKEESFATSLTDLRKLIDEIDAELAKIEKDETLKANPNAEKEEPAAAEGGAAGAEAAAEGEGDDAAEGEG